MDHSHSFVKLKLAPPGELALGGLIVGGLSLIAVWGNGYSVVQSYLLLPPSGALLVGVFICKLLAVLASSGSAHWRGLYPDAVCRLWRWACCLPASAGSGFRK